MKKYKHVVVQKITEMDIHKFPKVGRPLKRNLYWYVKKILAVLFTGISWTSLDFFANEGEPKGDTIRKNFIKWVEMGIFTESYNEYIRLYKQKNTNKLMHLIIDATVIPNFSGPKSMTGYDRKIHCKRSLKITSVSTDDGVIIGSIIGAGGNHDSTFIESTVDKLPNEIKELYSYKNPLIITGDKGYIISKNRKKILRKNTHATMNTENRKNMKKKDFHKKEKTAVPKTNSYRTRIFSIKKNI